jgi:predicted TIM-barrel fold metal-dependent hydrolase
VPPDLGRVVDADVHCAPDSMKALEPYLDGYWREYVESAGIRLTGMAGAYPPGAATSGSVEGGGAVPSTYDALRSGLLERSEAELVVLNCLTICEAYRNPYYQAALAAAINDWLRVEWLDRDERLRASLVVSTVDPEDAAREIERVAGDGRFVQVLLPVRADAPYGNKRYHRIYEAASAHDLAIGLHAWGRPGQATTPTGFTLSHLEDYLSNPIIVQTHVVSLVSEGVFERFPNLRVGLIECGYAWIPSLCWRFDKDWKGVLQEVPWVKDRPSAYIRRHFKATTEPSHLAPRDPRHVGELLDMLGAESLLYSSDFPHDHGATSKALYDALDEEGSRRVFSENAAGFFRLNG